MKTIYYYPGGLSNYFFCRPRSMSDCTSFYWTTVFTLEFTKASLCVVVGAPPFQFPLHTMKSIGLDPSTCPHQTTSQQDMAAPTPREKSPSRREGRKGPLKMLYLSPFFLFTEGEEQDRKWRRSGGCSCECNQGAVRTLI